MQYVQYGTNSTYMPDTQADQSIGYDRYVNILIEICN